MKKIRIWILSLIIIVPLFVYLGCKQYDAFRAESKVRAAVNSNYWQNMYHSFSKSQKMNGSVIFVGDSLTGLFDLSVFQNPAVLNRGICGDFSYGVLQRLDEVIRHNPSKIFIEIGINDIREEVPPVTTLTNYEAIIQRLKSGLPHAEIFVQSILPTADGHHNESALQLNQSLMELSSRYHVEFIDLYSHFVTDGLLDSELTTDGVHLSGRGYSIWHDVVAGHVTTQGYVLQ
ncbi:MAG: hypothetical protein HPY65_14420 [Syntrophaceae bacterium]|nr:hypothetical protein [Syntrophaceae bacterium]